MKRHSLVILLLLAMLPSTAFAQAAEPPVAPPPPPPAPVAQGPAAPAPSPYYGQPMYAQPGYGQPAYGPPPQPHRIVVPYVGGRLPPGATIENQRRMGLLIPGAILFGASYIGMIVHGLTCGTTLSTTGACLTTNRGWLYVPIVGPFIAISGSSNSVDSIALAVLGVFETLGAAGVIAGMLFPRRVVAYMGYGRENAAGRRTASQWSLLPAAPGALAGLTLSVTHY